MATSFLIKLPGRMQGLLCRSRNFRLAGQPVNFNLLSCRPLSTTFTSDFYKNRFLSNEKGRFSTDYRIFDPNPVNVHLTFRFGPEISGCGVNVRLLHSTGSFGEKASSKIEETVNRLKEKQIDSKPEVIATSQAVIENVDVKATSQVGSPATSQVSVVQKSMWQKIVDECKHYYSGFKLLFLDVRVSSGIIWKILNGNQLSRRESKQLVRTTSDLFRLVPFSVFVIVPFMELLLPVALKLFPGMLPSTFTTKSEREAKMKRTLVAKLEYAKFLQKTLDEMAPKGKGRDSKSASDFVSFYQKIKAQGSGIVNNEEILKFSKLFEDDITLDNMTRGQLSAICRLLELTPIGTSNFLRLQIEMRLRHLITDDKLIIKEGLDNMTVQELQNACKERGMRALGLSATALRNQMQQWLDLSQNAKVPPSLLLLSRTLYFAESAQPTEQLAATISALPESAATATKAQIGEREGKIRNVEKLEQIKEEQRKINEEAAEEKKQEELKKKVELAAAVKAAVITEAAAAQTADILKTSADLVTDATPAPSVETLMKEATGTLRKATVTLEGELKEELIDRAPVLIDKAEVMQPAEAFARPTYRQESVKSEEVKAKKDFHASDLSDLKTALASLGGQKAEVQGIKHLKKELEDYEEDLKDLNKIKEISHRSDLFETKAAKRLFSRVNKMLNRVDVLVASLETKEKEISAIKFKAGRTEEERERDDENLVTVQELIDAVTKLQGTPDASKLEQISQVLSLMDFDEDGVVNLDHVHKVIELLGTEHVRIPEKQVRQIIEMLAKEEMLEVAQKIENILEQTAPTKSADTEVSVDIKENSSSHSGEQAQTSTTDEHIEEEQRRKSK